MVLNVISPGLRDNYLAALEQDEELIGKAADAYEEAKAHLDVGVRRYTALRDFVTEKLGRSPYAPGVSWPGDEHQAFVPERGRFRFTGMRVGDAILQVLEEAADYPRWLSLEQIVERLSQGGLGFPDPIQVRAVNAALLKTAGVARNRMIDTGDAVYRFVDPSEESDEPEEGESPPVEPPDLPFE